mgnify:CR=1 FL=1
MTKKNLPNIPLYIGDWERDCNVLSLEAEAAWLKIIFKMFLNGQQSTYKVSTKALQNIWKSSPEKVSEILEELKFNEICEIEEIAGGYIFTSRRFLKQESVSKARSNAVSKRPDRNINSTKALQNDNKTFTKDIQTPENEIDIESKDENKEIKESVKTIKGNVIVADSPEDRHPEFFVTKKFKDVWVQWQNYKREQFNFIYKPTALEKAKIQLYNECEKDLEIATELLNQAMAKGWKGWHKQDEKPKNGLEQIRQATNGQKSKYLR